ALARAGCPLRDAGRHCGGAGAAGPQRLGPARCRRRPDRRRPDRRPHRSLDGGGGPGRAHHLTQWTRSAQSPGPATRHTARTHRSPEPMAEHEIDEEDHGHSIAAWAAVITILVGAAVAA